MSRILISAGDYSADLHGESLVKEMRMIDPSLHVTALGGVKLKSVANEFLNDMVNMDVSGFSQPIKQFFTLKKILQQAVFPRLDSKQTDAVILIDYYGFNIHIAEKAKERKIPVFYFVSPQVWASRRWRIQKLKNAVTKMLVIFPFEEMLYRKSGVPVAFVGHPLMDTIPEQKNRRDFNNIMKNGPIPIGLMPGSRQRELVRHVPLMIECFNKLKKNFPKLQPNLFAVDSIPDNYYHSLIDSSHSGKNNVSLPDLHIIREADYKKRSEMVLSLTASGTATLENALLGIPMIVIYKTSWLTYLIVRKIIQVPFISMPNILSGKAIVPELIQHHATRDIVTQTAIRLLSNPDLLEKMRSELIELRKQLGEPGAYRRAAKIILGTI